MAHIWIWNSFATRRRGISDTILESGLHIIKTYLETHRHQVRIVDWVDPDFYRSLSPRWLARLIRRIVRRFLVLVKAGKRKGAVFSLLGASMLVLQDALTRIQKHRMEKRIILLVREIVASGVKVVGVRVWYGEAFTWSKKLIALLKAAAPEILTIAGGYHVTLYDTDILRYADFDLGVVCEGEFALKEILDIVDAYEGRWDKEAVLSCIREGAAAGQIRNLVYREQGQILRSQRYDYIKTEKTIPEYAIDSGKTRLHVVIESLGCDWGKCNFCVHPFFYDRYYIRPAEDVVKEVARMVEKGIGVFRFAGSDTPPPLGAKIARRIIDEKLMIIYSIGSRATRNASDPQVYQRLVNDYAVMITSGLRAVFMGGECGNDWVNQEVMNKGVITDDLLSSIRALREAAKIAGHKVNLSLALIYPVPLMNKMDLQSVFDDNLRLVQNAQPDSVIVTPPGPFKHTTWFSQRDTFGFHFSDDLIPAAMEYEYVLYKSPALWPPLDYSLDRMSFKMLLAECGRLRNTIERDLRIPTDVTDEDFLFVRAAGEDSKEGVLRFKEESQLDIISCDYSFIDAAGSKLSRMSRLKAGENQSGVTGG